MTAGEVLVTTLFFCNGFLQARAQDLKKWGLKKLFCSKRGVNIISIFKWLCIFMISVNFVEGGGNKRHNVIFLGC